MSAIHIRRIPFAARLMLFVALWLVSSQAASALAETPLQWRVASSGTPGTEATFYGVTALASGDAWAVGNYTSKSGQGKTLTERWDGTRFKVVSSPSVANTFYFLLGGTAVASNNAWAVGYYYNESTPNRTLILHWNGKRWRIVPSPNASPDWNVLYAVTAAPGGPATAVGYYFDTDNTTKTLVEASR